MDRESLAPNVDLGPLIVFNRAKKKESAAVEGCPGWQGEVVVDPFDRFASKQERATGAVQDASGSWNVSNRQANSPVVGCVRLGAMDNLRIVD